MSKADSRPSEGGSPGGESGGRSRINPMTWPDNLRQYRQKRADDPDAAEVQDPHAWDDPDPGALARVTPNTTAGWLLAWAAAIITIAVLAYLVPIFASTLLDPVLWVGVFLLSSHVGVYLKGRTSGIETYVELDKHVNYYGDGADIRAGKKAGRSGPEYLFTPLRDFSWAGFKSRYLLKRDLPYSAEKLRSYGNDSGDDEVEDALNKTTVEVDTETLGTFLVTHSGGRLDYAAQSNDADRRTPLPETLDEDVVEDVQLLIKRLRRQIKEAQADAEELERAAEDARDLRDKQLAPELEQSLMILKSLQSTIEEDRRNNRSEESAGIEAVRESADRAMNNGGYES